MKIFTLLLVLVSAPSVALAFGTWDKAPGANGAADSCTFDMRGEAATQWCHVDADEATSTTQATTAIDTSKCENLDAHFISELGDDTTFVNTVALYNFQSDATSISATDLVATKIRGEDLTGNATGTDLSKMLGETAYRLYARFSTTETGTTSRLSVVCHPRPSK